MSRNLCTIRACSKDSTFMRGKLRGKCESFSFTTPDPIPFVLSRGLEMIWLSFRTFFRLSVDPLLGKTPRRTSRRARFSFIVTRRQTAIDVSFSFPLASDRACQRYPVACLKQPLQAHCIGRGRPRTASPTEGFHLCVRPRGSSNVRASLFDSRPAAIRAFAAGGQGCSIEAAQE